MSGATGGGRRFDAAGMDRSTRVITNLTIGTVLIVPAAISLTGDAVATGLTAVLTLGVLPVAWAMSPRAYELEGDRLVVRRRLWRPFVATVEGFSDHEEPWRLGLRTGGSGGAWGWWGRFRRSDIKGYRAYMTTREHDTLVSLRTSRGVVVLSPADAKAFTRAVRTTLR